MAQTLTIRLSDLALQYLQKTAKLTSRPVDEIIEQSLVHSLPPLLDDVPEEYQDKIYPLLQMSIIELKAEMLRVFPASQWEAYEALLIKQKEQTLTKREQSRLDKLRQEADVFTFRKAYAAVLLKRLGYHLPSVNELPLP